MDDDTPSTNTHAKVNHDDSDDGSDSPKNAMPSANNSTVCNATVTSTMPTLPRKYDAFGMGVPARRFNMPDSRSMLMPMARLTKPVDMSVEPMMPAT